MRMGEDSRHSSQARCFWTPDEGASGGSVGGAIEFGEVRIGVCCGEGDRVWSWSGVRGGTWWSKVSEGDVVSF